MHYHELLDLMDRLAKFLDLPTDRFKPHSFRIGATTDLHLKGYSSQVIQKKGRWSSAAFQRLYPCLIQITEQSAVWMIGDYHLQHMIPKFIRNKARYPELAVFEHFEYHFDQQMRLHQVPGNFAEMLNIYTHVPQALVIMVGGNDLGIATKAQTRARAEDMLTDLIGLWEKCKPAKTNRLGLFVSLVPPKLWYRGFVQQKAGREARRSLNSHLGKVAKQLGAIVIPHPLILGRGKVVLRPKT